jgi:cation diffusion facilitator family transporter
MAEQRESGDCSAGEEKPIVVYGAIACNLGIAATKFIAAVITGSSAMLSEGIHSVVDTGNELLLLLGVHRSKRAPDDMHPFGYGMELYFWSLMVAVLLFGLGGGFSIYEGVSRLRTPRPLESPTLNYIVLGIAFIMESVSWIIASKGLRKRAGKGVTLWRAMRMSKDPSVFIVLAEDSAALIGLVIATVGVFLSHHFAQVWDAIASIAIGVTLAVVAVYLTFECKGLLAGESANPQLVSRVRDVASADPAVVAVQRPLTMHLGPEEILLAMGVEFKPELSAPEIIRAIERLEAHIRQVDSRIRQIFIEAESFRQKPAE